MKHKQRSNFHGNHPQNRYNHVQTHSQTEDVTFFSVFGVCSVYHICIPVSDISFEQIKTK